MSRYLVGIDLGTSNTVVAYAEPGEDRVRLLQIEQLVAPGEVGARPLLPSLRYHPVAGELAQAELRLPWCNADDEESGTAVIGVLARDLGSRVPGRLVASAKSWLSHSGVDRSAAILPWGADAEVVRVSPLEASASYLAHVHAAWNARFPEAPLAQQEIVLTVPASFDEGARALTVEAARLAGLPALRLIEEPQAAFQDWLFRHRGDLAEALAQSRLVLVCDVGGGTTDLSLMQVEPGAAGAPPRVTRIGVGEHLMLGGDNMDLALAHRVEQRIRAGDKHLSAGQLSQLVQRCRVAKEQLLAEDPPERVAVTLLGAGSKLVGASRSVELTRREVEGLVVDGFFPVGSALDRPRRRSAGIVEFGLPYPADAAITRHLAAFLQRHAAAARAALGERAPAQGELPLPDAVLLNGGVFRASAIAERLVHTLGEWCGRRPKVLHNDQPDVAVARGAVAFALARAGRAPDIGGGSARSVMLLLDDSSPSPRGICVMPRGTASGQVIDLPGRSFALRLGQPVRFHLASSSSDTAWHAGELVELDGEEFARLPPVATVLPAPAGCAGRDVTVRLAASMTDVGTLEMQCVRADDPAQRWSLAFQLRAEAEPAAVPAAAPSRAAEAIELIERVFGDQSKQVDAGEVRQLRARLERCLGPRDEWDLALLRTLFDALLARAKRRRRSAGHERVWLNLAGFCLRPGVGAMLDEWRCEQLWLLYEQGLQYVQESRNWAEWWTLWRRAAAGLGEDAQLRLLETLAGHLEHADAGKRRGDPLQGAYDDMLRLAATLEKVPVMHRIEVGQWLLERLRRPGENVQGWWALGRVGARQPLHAGAHGVVPPDIVCEWLEQVLALDWKAIGPAAFAAAQMARLSGDRARDLAPELREEVARRLAAARTPPSWIAMVREGVSLDESGQRLSFGESLPPGLKLIGG